jgi:hypothetical protein
MAREPITLSILKDSIKGLGIMESYKVRDKQSMRTMLNMKDVFMRGGNKEKEF